MPLRLRCKRCSHSISGTYADKCVSCGAVDWERDTSPAKAEASSTSPLQAGVFTLFGLGIWLLFMMWDSGKLDLEQMGWWHHDAMTTVFMHDWVNGEYKQCVSINETQPFLVCGESKGDGKLFKVRFYGRTHNPKLSPEAELHWTCKRSYGDDPMFVCERQPSNESTEAQPSAQTPSTPLPDHVGDQDMDDLRKRNACEARFTDKGIYDVDGMSPIAACKQNPNRVPR